MFEGDHGMKAGAKLVLAFAGACLTAPGAAAADFSLNKRTTKSIAAFRDCFLTSQSQAKNALSFVPNARGGVFSNDGGLDPVGNSYRLQVVDNGRFRTIAMQPADSRAAPEPPVTAAIEQCL
jgi:hypothetical protein